MKKLYSLFTSVLMVLGLCMPISAESNTIEKNDNQITITITSGDPDIEFTLNDAGDGVKVGYSGNYIELTDNDEILFTTNGNVVQDDFSVNFNNSLNTLKEPITLNITLQNFKINNAQLWHSTWNHAAYNNINVILMLEGDNQIAVGSDRVALRVPSGSTYTIGGTGSIKLTGQHAISGGGNICITDNPTLATDSSSISGVKLYNHSDNASWGEKITLNSIALNETEKALYEGETFLLDVDFEPSDVPTDEQSITWSSSDEKVATVDEHGKVAAVKEGTTTITATSTIDPNISASCEITVIKNLYSVSVTPNKISLPTVTEGYDPQDPKTITIKNTGNQTIILENHGKNPWLIITLDKNILNPNEEATVSIKLKDNLSADTRSTLKGFITYTSEDGTYRDQAHFQVTYEVKHDMKYVDAKEPTHLEDGNIAYWYCAYCDKYYKGGAGAHELSLEDITIPKLKDHTATDIWHHDEKSHWHTCECGEILDKADHDFKWVIDKEATATNEGLKHEECSICGYQKESIVIPTTEVIITNTGDSSNILVWCATAMVSAAALIGIVVIYQRKKITK